MSSMKSEANGKECVPLPSPGRGLTQCKTSGAVAVWNNHTVYLYHEQRLKEKPIVMTTDFIVQQVLLSNINAVCIDSNGIAHTQTLKFKSKSDKSIEIPYKPRAQGILSCCQVNEDIAICINVDLMLCVHKLNTEFKTIKTYKVQFNGPMKDDLRGNIIIKASEQNVDKNIASKLFNKQMENGECVLILFSIDRYTVYGQIIDLKDKEDKIVPVKLFVCPSEIADIQANMSGFKIIIGLKSGTIVCLTYAESKLEAKIVHLNAAIYKMIMIDNDNIMYTDGTKMWTSDLFSERGANYKKVFVTQPKCLIKNENRIICITFNNILYSFSLDSDGVYVKQKPTEDGFEVPRDFTTIKRIVSEMMKEVERNEEILKKIKLENTLMTAVALSRQCNILDKHITITTHVYDSYEHVSGYVSVTQTRPVKDYFEPNNVSLLVKLQTSSEFRQTFNEICSCLPNIRLLVSISYGKESETTAIPLDYKMYENFTWLIPVRSDENPASMELSIKILSPLSEVVDSTNFWTILYSKVTILNAEHFIKIDDVMTREYRERVKSAEETVMDFAKATQGALYDFQLPQKKNSKEWSCYLKLPKYFQKIICDKSVYAKTLNSRISEYLSNKFASREFQKGNQILYINVCERKVAFQITIEDESSVLKISGCDASVVYELRQYFSNLLYDRTNGGSELVAQSLYTRTESLRRRLREELSGGGDAAAILDIAHQFHRHSLGALPL